MGILRVAILCNLRDNAWLSCERGTSLRLNLRGEQSKLNFISVRRDMSPMISTRKKAQRQNLLKKKAELIANQEPDTLVWGVRSPDSVELAAHSVEQDVATWTVNLRFETLREIDGALNRLDDGDYGTCESCGESIASNRLKALPWARFCVACQEIGTVSVN